MNTRNVTIMSPGEVYQFVLSNPKDTKLPGDPIVICNCGLELYGSDITWLPEELLVMGDMHIKNCTNLQELPAKLFVGGNLYMSDSKIRVIPVGMKVCGDIHAEGMELDFPNIFIAHRNLYLNDKTDSPNFSPLRLPKAYLTVNGVFDIRNRKNVEWPDSMTLYGRFLSDEISDVIIAKN